VIQWNASQVVVQKTIAGGSTRRATYARADSTGRSYDRSSALASTAITPYQASAFATWPDG
jgi:hypothetical protein